MGKPRSARPTDAELALLRVLWQLGPSTVRQVHAALEGDPPVGYTTVLKLLQIMAAKGLVTRDESQRTHVYTAKEPEEKTLRGLVGDLVDRAFAGSARKLMVHALALKPSTPEELAEIRTMLDQIEREQHGSSE